jgi:hypothetical protein
VLERSSRRSGDRRPHLSSFIGGECWEMIHMSVRCDLGGRVEAMQVRIFVERLDEQTFCAEMARPIALIVEGRTRDEAIERLQVLPWKCLTSQHAR